MPRVKRAVNAKKKRNKALKLAKGFRGAKSKLLKTVYESVERSLQYGYRDRKNKKRDMRALWIARINAAARLNGLSYSRLIAGLNKAEVELDRKQLSAMAIEDPKGFTKVVEIAKNNLAA